MSQTIFRDSRGRFHREDGPAVIIGNRREWWINGKRERLDGPAVEDDDIQYRCYYQNNLKKRTDPSLPTLILKNRVEYFDSQGRQHKDDGPAVIDPDEGLEVYMKNGKLDRKGNKPAYKSNTLEIYAENGIIGRNGNLPAVIKEDSVEYYTDGKLGRPDAPGIVYENGSEEYYTDGKLGRKTGPAIINEAGGETYALDGKTFKTKEDFDKEIDKYDKEVMKEKNK